MGTQLYWTKTGVCLSILFKSIYKQIDISLIHIQFQIHFLEYPNHKTNIVHTGCTQENLPPGKRLGVCGGRASYSFPTILSEILQGRKMLLLPWG